MVITFSEIMFLIEKKSLIVCPIFIVTVCTIRQIDSRCINNLTYFETNSNQLNDPYMTRFVNAIG